MGVPRATWLSLALLAKGEQSQVSSAVAFLHQTTSAASDNLAPTSKNEINSERRDV